MSQPRRLSFLLSLPVSLSALLLGCGNSDRDELFVSGGAALLQAANCEDLLEQIQEDALAKVDLQLKNYKRAWKENDRSPDGPTVGWDLGESDGDGDVISAPNPSSPPASGGDESGGGSGAPESPESPKSYSETNTQIEGVDEADIVKTDGERIYLLHGSDFFLLDAWPADETRVLGSTPIEGSGVELFVQGGKAVLFSNVFPGDLPESAQRRNKGDVAYDCYDCGGGTGYTQISVFDVKGDSPKLEREILFEGSYVSGRRHGDVVRTIVQGGFQAPSLFSPSINPYDSFGKLKSDSRIEQELNQWRESVKTDIQNTQLSDWLPYRFERVGSKWEELATQCEGYYIPEPGVVNYGVTQVVTFDAQKSEEVDVTAILGGAETVYANHDVLVLGQTNYDWQFGGESTKTALHQFRLSGADSQYEASGFVPGYLHNQFSIDEQAGVIRVSTTERVRANDSGSNTENRVYTLNKKDNELQVLAKTEAFGDPGETIFATRFLGDRGYVVTFRQVDPLIVVDLSNPEKPKVLGDLHIPGFSDYIHPLGEHQLLTIGQDADESGFQSGVALQIFDVSDPGAPKLTHKEAFGGFSHSEANNNHKAFTFVKDYFGKDQGLLLFPITTYSAEYQSRLEVVRVSAETGFKRLGSLDHTALLLDNCDQSIAEDGFSYCSYSGNDMRRGVQIDDYIYAISYGGVTVHELDQLSETVAKIELPTPKFQWSWGWGAEGGGVDTGVGGSAGEPVPVDEDSDGSSR